MGLRSESRLLQTPSDTCSRTVLTKDNKHSSARFQSQQHAASLWLSKGFPSSTAHPYPPSPSLIPSCPSGHIHLFILQSLKASAGVSAAHIWRQHPLIHVTFASSLVPCVCYSCTYSSVCSWERTQLCTNQWSCIDAVFMGHLTIKKQ